MERDVLQTISWNTSYDHTLYGLTAETFYQFRAVIETDDGSTYTGETHGSLTHRDEDGDPYIVCPTGE